MAAHLTDTERDHIIDRIRAGDTRNDIARSTGRSPDTITKVARQAGLGFDRTATKAATAAKQADNRARRAELAAKNLDAAHRLHSQLFAPCVVHSFGGRDNTYNEHNLTEPTFRDKRDIASSISTLVTTIVNLERVDQGSDVEGAKSLIGAIAAGLGAAAAELEPPDDPAGD